VWILKAADCFSDIKKMRRKLINKREEKISWLQIIGFGLILIGVMYLVLNLFFYTVNSADISIIFLVIMLGFAFAFPELLKDDNNGLSTMRLVVFMIVNVICMLLLKLGWDSKSLEDIGVNQYWMGIIAFVFGAKAVQSFFESSMAYRKNEKIKDVQSDNVDDLPMAGINIIAEAIKKKQ
jgi:hypothetical protein